MDRGFDIDIDLPRPRTSEIVGSEAFGRYVAQIWNDLREVRNMRQAFGRGFYLGGMLAGALSYRLFVFSLPLSFFLISGTGLLASALGDITPAGVAFAGGSLRDRLAAEA